MWKQLIRCSIVGGIIVFLWTAIAWMVLPMHKMQINQFADPSEVAQTITRYAPHDGIYSIPSWEDRAKMERGQKGATIFVNIRRGVDLTDMTGSLVTGLITQIIGAFIVTYLVLKTKSSKYWDRVWFVTLAGLFVGIIGILPAWNWWNFPFAWAFLDVFDLVVGWFLAGLVIAKLARK